MDDTFIIDNPDSEQSSAEDYPLPEEEGFNSLTLPVALAEMFGSQTPLNEEFLDRAYAVLEEAVMVAHENLIKENQELLQINYDLMLDRIFDDFTIGLTLSQKERMRSLCVNMDLDPENPFEDWQEKLSTLRDSLYPRHPRETGFEDESISGPERGRTLSPDMSAYSHTLSQLSKYRKSELP